MDEVLLGLCLVVVLSVLARLLATVIRVPAIVPLLVVGVLAGTSVTGLVDPEALLGDALSPAVQIAVGIILFEGALSLKREELASGVRPAVIRLITFGVLITWVLASIAVGVLLDIPHPIAILIGAVLIVSGPTVVIPILEFISPSTHVRSVLKWEGILVDPIGAIIAVVVFGSLASENGKLGIDFVEIILSMGSGLLVGVVAAVLLMPLLGTRRLAGRDKVAATLMLVVASFAAADALFADSGLVATIVMGVVLANQSKVETGYIAEFKETLVPILIGILFILLAANVSVSSVVDLGLPGLALVAVIVLVIRPLAALTTLGLPFSWRERAFFAGMAPRGIVAASTASAFGLDLTQQGIPGAEKIIPITFLVIVGTVFVYALGSPWLAKVLGVAGEKPPSLLLIGGPAWAVAMGGAMKRAGAEVRVWTEDEDETRAAEAEDLIVFGGALDQHSGAAQKLKDDLSAVALVSEDDTLNQLLSMQFAEAYEADQVYRRRSPVGVAPIVKSDASLLFDGINDMNEIERRVAAGEKMMAFSAGDQLPAESLILASLHEREGGSPPTVRLASPTTRKVLSESGSTLIVLAPSQEL